MYKPTFIMCGVLLLTACGEADVGSECTSANHCILRDGTPACEADYEWEDPSDDNNLRCVAAESGPLAGDPCPQNREGYEQCRGDSVMVCSLGRWELFETCEEYEDCADDGQSAHCQRRKSPGPTGGNNCGTEGQTHCSNNTLMQCSGGVEVVLQECPGQCVIANSQLACEGGARPFSVGSMALEVDGAISMSLSTTTGNPACGLVDDYEVSPGLEAEQLYIILANVGWACPEGVYGLNSSCDVNYPSSSSARCAVYRRWDSSGRLVSVEALSGSITVSQTGSSCAYEVDVVAGGQSMSVTAPVDVTGVGPSGSQKWCGDF